MTITLEHVLETEWMYILALVFVSIQAFGVGLVIGFLWVKIF
jgi:hypothetical protein